jgi:hypothetical protein
MSMSLRSRNARNPIMLQTLPREEEYPSASSESYKLCLERRSTQADMEPDLIRAASLGEEDLLVAARGILIKY